MIYKNAVSLVAAGLTFYLTILRLGFGARNPVDEAAVKVNASYMDGVKVNWLAG